MKTLLALLVSALCLAQPTAPTTGGISANAFAGCTFTTGTFSCPSTISAGVGSGNTGALDLTAKTSMATYTITVDDNGNGVAVKVADDATSGLYFATVTSKTPAAGCAHFNGTSTELTSTGVECGGSGGSSLSFGSPYLVNGTDSYFSPGPFIVPPSLASWTWMNQGSATVTSFNGAVLLKAPAQSGDSVHCLFSNNAYPTTPWATPWTVGVVSTFVGVNYFLAGIAIADGTNPSTSKMQTFGVGQVNNMGYTFANWNSTTSNSAATAVTFPLSTITYLTLNDSGTNIDFWVSNDFHNLKQVNAYHAPSTTFLTAAKIGFCIDPANNASTGGGSLMFVHWTGPVL